MNKLLIKEKSVEINTDIEYKAIELHYNGNLYIENLLPQDYIVSKNNNKIIIIKFNKREEILSELFNYNGYCNIAYAFLVDKDLEKHSLNIIPQPFIDWKKITDNFEDLKTNFEDLKNIMTNRQSNNFKVTKKIDPDTDAITINKETFKTASNFHYKDFGLTRLSDFNTNTNKTKKSLKKGQQIKRGY